MTRFKTFELVERKKKEVQLKLTFRQQADRQTITRPGNPGEFLEVELQSMEGMGGGELAYHLDRTHPHGTTEVTSDTTMSMSAQGRDMAMAMSMELKVDFEGQ